MAAQHRVSGLLSEDMPCVFSHVFSRSITDDIVLPEGKALSAKEQQMMRDYRTKDNRAANRRSMRNYADVAMAQMFSDIGPSLSPRLPPHWEVGHTRAEPVQCAHTLSSGSCYPFLS